MKKDECIPNAPLKGAPRELGMFAEVLENLAISGTEVGRWARSPGLHRGELGAHFWALWGVHLGCIGLLLYDQVEN